MFMIDTPAQPEPRLWTPEGFREDAWHHGEGSEALISNARLILPLADYLALDENERRSAGARFGVVLQPGDRIEAIVEDLPYLGLVALAFPAFSDGRSFSKAALLRSRYGFTGSVRATGQILVDQLPHMLRVGFDEFEISNPVLLRRLEKGDTGGLPLQYQPSAKPSTGGQAYSWRRKPGD